MLPALPFWANLALFAGAAALVWIAGRYVVRQADALESLTGAGEALVGMLLLGFITALPEAAVTVTASASGNAALALNNLLGSMALNVAILAAADAAVKREALSSAVATPTPILQAALSMTLLAAVAAATVLGDTPLLGIGAWSWGLGLAYLGCLWLVRKTRGRRPWVPEGGTLPEAPGRAPSHASLGQVAARLAAGAVFILAAGFVLAQTGDALAEQTGLGASFFGAVFIALSTSLPEITIVFSAVRLARYEMAIADILGANLFGMLLIFLADAAYPGGPVLAEAGRFSTFAALLAIALSGLFVAGLVERRHRMVLHMGVDSILVLLVYGAGLAALYRLR